MKKVYGKEQTIQDFLNFMYEQSNGVVTDEESYNEYLKSVLAGMDIKTTEDADIHFYHNWQDTFKNSEQRIIIQALHSGKFLQIESLDQYAWLDDYKEATVFDDRGRVSYLASFFEKDTRGLDLNNYYGRQEAENTLKERRDKQTDDIEQRQYDRVHEDE